MPYLIDKEAAPRIWEGWQAMMCVFDEGHESTLQAAVENMMEMCDLSARTCENMVKQALRDGVLDSITRKGVKTLRLSDEEGQEMFETVGTGVEAEGGDEA